MAKKITVNKSMTKSCIAVSHLQTARRSGDLPGVLHLNHLGSLRVLAAKGISKENVKAAVPGERREEKNRHKSRINPQNREPR
ncbi:MAG TPA: hypothetical protein VGG56_12080 [Terracidiphilus sp.]|jgi:hypothetical protein